MAARRKTKHCVTVLVLRAHTRAAAHAHYSFFNVWAGATTDVAAADRVFEDTICSTFSNDALAAVAALDGVAPVAAADWPPQLRRDYAAWIVAERGDLTEVGRSAEQAIVRRWRVARGFLSLPVHSRL